MGEPTGAPPGGARRTDPSNLGGFLAVVVQLALVLAVVRQFEIAERGHFFAVACLAAAGYLVHAWLPARLRVPFFCLLSAGGVLLVLGWPNGPLVLAVGAALIALCLVPVPFAVRVALVGLAGLGLAVYRIEHPLPFWSVLGSMFMFRIVLYLHELRRSPRRPPLAITLAYFFPLPNVSFLFFPILDFRTFRETYLPAARWTDAQEGVGWVLRGLTHLLAYRAVKYFVLPDPYQLGDVPYAALFLAANYALYLHVSGNFHIVTGVLHLFGFMLPRTHHNYFLASSFTDVWRRLNIPWKDFLATVFFTPAFFARRGLGTRGAAAAATLWVFAATWLLHSYQVFWLTGGVSLSGYEAMLWLGLGVLVAVNLQFELSRPGRRVGPLTPLAAVAWAVRVVGMFALISVFGACWNTPAVVGSVRALPDTDPDAARGAALVLGVMLAAVVVLAASRISWDRLTNGGRWRPTASPRTTAAWHVAALGALALGGLPGVTDGLGPRAAGVVASLRHESATPAEAAQVVQGYYEEIADARVPAGAWLATLEGRPRPPDKVHYSDLSRPTDDLLERELIPGWSGEVAGSRLTINRFGMRDRADLSQAKPPGTRRVAVVGSSVVMGYGVGDDEVFTRLLEDRLNAGGGPPVEVLNFGTGRSYVIQRHVLIDRKVFAFEPDVLVYVAHQDEFLGPVQHLAKLVAKGHPLPYPSLGEVVRKAGVTPDTSWGMTEALLRPHAREIVLGVYRHLVAECRRRGVRPVWVYLPVPGVEAPAAVVVALAREAGFAVVDLSGWAGGRRPAEVKLGDADHHANALGHRLIAARLADELRRRPALLSGP